MVIILNISTNRKNHLEYFDAKIMIFLQKQSFRPAFLSFSLNFPTRERFVNFLKFIDLPQKRINRNSHGGEKNGLSFVPIVTLCPSRFSTFLIISNLQKPAPLRRQFQRVERDLLRHQKCQKNVLKHPKQRIKPPQRTCFCPLKMT